MKKFKNYKFVEIEWLDACMRPGDFDASQDVVAPTKHVTRGWLVASKRKWITIAPERVDDGHDFRDATTILKGMIVSITEIEVSE